MFRSRAFSARSVSSICPKPKERVIISKPDWGRSSTRSFILMRLARSSHSNELHNGKPGNGRHFLRVCEEMRMKSQIESQAISIPIAGNEPIDGDLNVPANSRAIVLFAHGSGSSRHSPRNKYVAEELNKAGFSTLLLDLLTPDEEVVDQRTAHLRFDIELLAERLIAATDWLSARPNREAQHIGYFGASTGAAAALVAAAKRPKLVEAVVSRGGRPDLAGSSLSAVRAPTLLLVGELDD